MNNAITPLLALLSVVWLFGGTWWLSNTFCGVNTTIPKGFSLSDGAFKTTAVEAFSFGHSDAELAFQEDMKRALKSTAVYLSENTDRQLVLSGLYTKAERNDTEYNDLGMARATKVKAVLVDSGADADRISIDSRSVDNLSFLNKKLYDGVQFNFVDVPAEEDSNGSPKEEPALDPIDQKLIINYEDRDFEYLPDGATEDLFRNWLLYIRNKPGARVVVLGHSDELGSPAANERMANLMANKVRRVLRDEYSFRTPEVTARSRGARQPIADNDTAEGRRQNRRVELWIEEE
ncbi:MAG: OmpA family protein [Bacteroidota bacterium]